MSSGLRTVIASCGAAQFEFLHEIMAGSGHVPLAYMVSRSMRPSGPPEADLLEAVNGIVAGLPVGMDLLLPGSAGAAADMLAGYKPDLILVYGFNWRLPREVLDLPRLGVVNIHPSALPKYRGPSPVLWAVRNGDPAIGITAHRMNEHFDAGPVLAQVSGIPLPEDVSHEDVWELTKNALPDLLERALDALARGDPGTPQDESEASYAGFPPRDWFEVTWQSGRVALHNQIRVLRMLSGGQGPVTELAGRPVRIVRTSLVQAEGTRVECADGPLWVTCAEEGSS